MRKKMFIDKYKDELMQCKLELIWFQATRKAKKKSKEYKAMRSKIAVKYVEDIINAKEIK